MEGICIYLDWAKAPEERIVCKMGRAEPLMKLKPGEGSQIFNYYNLTTFDVYKIDSSLLIKKYKLFGKLKQCQHTIRL